MTLEEIRTVRCIPQIESSLHIIRALREVISCVMFVELCSILTAPALFTTLADVHLSFWIILF